MINFIIVFLSCFNFSSASVFTDQFKSLTDISFECPVGCDANEVTKSELVRILSNVDCDSSDARWDFKITVSPH